MQEGTHSVRNTSSKFMLPPTAIVIMLYQEGQNPLLLSTGFITAEKNPNVSTFSGLLAENVNTCVPVILITISVPIECNSEFVNVNTIISSYYCKNVVETRVWMEWRYRLKNMTHPQLPVICIIFYPHNGKGKMEHLTLDTPPIVTKFSNFKILSWN